MDETQILLLEAVDVSEHLVLGVIGVEDGVGQEGRSSGISHESRINKQRNKWEDTDLGDDVVGLELLLQRRGSEVQSSFGGGVGGENFEQVLNVGLVGSLVKSNGNIVARQLSDVDSLGLKG